MYKYKFMENLEELRCEFEYHNQLFLYWVQKKDYATATKYFNKAHQLLDHLTELEIKHNTPINERATLLISI